MFKKKNKKIIICLYENQRSYWFLLIIIIIWTIIIVVNVIIIAVVIIIIVNVKEMYTSHGLICSTVENLAVFFHSYLSSLSQPFSLSLSSSPVPSRFFSCLSLLFNLESMCHCWYIAYYFFIGERYKARQNKKESKNNPWDQTGVFLFVFFGCVYCVISSCCCCCCCWVEFEILWK